VRGLTLIESLLAMAIAAILLTGGVATFRGALLRLQLTAVTNDLVLAINLARAEATARHARVAIVPRAVNDWASGWHVFIDANDNGQFDSGETVVRTFDPVPARLTIEPTFGSFDGHVLSFDRVGLLRRPGSNGMLLGRVTLTSEADVRTLCFSAASVRVVRAAACS